MISRLSEIIALFLNKHKIIDDSEVPVCQYGYEIIISTAVGFLSVMLLGVILCEPVGALLFYTLFILIRLFTGGYHASTHFRCKMTLSMCCALVIISMKEFSRVSIISPILLVIYLATVIVYSPIENKNAPLTQEVKQRNRMISIIMAVILSITAIITYKYIPKYSVLLTATLFAVSVLIIIAKINERKEMVYDKGDKKDFEIER